MIWRLASFDATTKPLDARGCRLFIGVRSDPFFADGGGAFHDFQFTGEDTFAGKNVLSMALEVPNDMLGPGPDIGVWATVSVRREGSLVQVDHIGIPWRHPDASQLDESMANMMCELADKGYLDQMVITYDRWFFNPRGAATEENPQLLNEKVNLGYLFTKFAPRLRGKGFKDADLEKMLVDNPQRILPMDSLH